MFPLSTHLPLRHSPCCSLVLALVSQSPTNTAGPILCFPFLSTSHPISPYTQLSLIPARLFFLKSGSKHKLPHKPLWQLNFHRIKSRLLSVALSASIKSPPSFSAFSVAVTFTSLLSESELLLTKSNRALPSHQVDRFIPIPSLGTFFPKLFLPKS